MQDGERAVGHRPDVELEAVRALGEAEVNEGFDRLASGEAVRQVVVP